MTHNPYLESISNGTCAVPYDVLGVHGNDGGAESSLIRSFQPYAKSVELICEGAAPVQMTKIHANGMFEIALKTPSENQYQFKMTGFDDASWTLHDPYSFPLQLSELDQHLVAEGTNCRAFNKMGAQLMEINGVHGVHFAVWAPNAQRVSIIGEFNRWDGRHHPMQTLGGSGIWALFIPALTSGDLYKFEILDRAGELHEKTDPYGFASELRPRTASVVHDVGTYEWNDAEWIKKRETINWYEEPIAAYEVHLGSWKRKGDAGEQFLTYRELAADLIPYVKDLGYTHIELMPITEHPLDASWGYQVVGYFAPTSRFGTPDDFKYFVDQCHQAGIGVILDWVPAHFPKDSHGLGHFDGTALYEHEDPRMGEHKDWGTKIFNYGRNEVRSFLISNAVFWCDLYHIDGLRVDAVASMLYLDYSREDGEWVANEFGGNENLEAIAFIKQFNEVIHAEVPGVLTFAEESTSWANVSRPTYIGGLGFGLKWNMGWMNDTLDYMSKEPVFRKYHQGNLTFSLIYAFTENFILPMSHDEVVHGKGSLVNKMPGDPWQQFANLRLLYLLMYTHPGKKLLFMGCEFAQWEEWNFDQSLDWHLVGFDRHRQIQSLVRDLNKTYCSETALHQVDFEGQGFEWIDFQDADNSVISFLRINKAADESLVVALNYTPVLRKRYRIGVPEAGTYSIVLNSDSDFYGGSNTMNPETIESDEGVWQGQEHSLSINLPPLGGLIMKIIPQT